MKNILLAITTCFALVANSFAQCPDASITAPGFHPPADQLPEIENGVPYNETVQVNIPASFDTTVPPLGTLTVDIDSIHVDNVANMPSGISYACDPPSCTFPGGSPGCITFSGTTTDPDGQYDLDILITANVTVPILGQQTQQLSMATLGFTYYLTVTSTPVFVQQTKNLEFNVFPNPSNGVFTLTHPGLDKSASLQIFDMTGKTVFTDVINEIGSIRKQVDLSALPKGIYSAHLISESDKGVQRLTIY